MKVKVKDINITNDEITFVIKTNITEKKFYFKFPIKISPTALNEILLIPSTIALYIASYCENVTLVMPQEMIHKPQMKKLSKYIALDDSHLTNSDIYTPNITFRTPKENQLHVDMIIDTNPDAKNYNSLVSASGGKESLLNKAIQEELGFTPLLYQVATQTIAYNRGMKPYTEKIYNQPIFVGKTNTNHLKTLFPIPEKRVENFEGLPYMLYRNCIIGIQSIWGMILAKHFSIPYVFGSHEFDEALYYKGKKYTENLTEHPLWFNYLSSISDIKYFSLLYPLTRYTEMYLIDNFYYNKCKDFSSCLTQINKFCGKCDKCFTSYIWWKSLNIDPKRYGFDEQKLFQNHRFFKKHSIIKPTFYLPSIDKFNFLKDNIVQNLNNNPQPGNESIPLYKFIMKIPYSSTPENMFGYEKSGLKHIPKEFRPKIEQLIKKWDLPEINEQK